MHVSDTPVKISPVPTGARNKTRRVHLDEAVQMDLWKMFTAADTDRFLNELFNVDTKTVDGIYEELQKRGLYRKNEWKGMVLKGKATDANEKDLYKPFVEIANNVAASPSLSSPHAHVQGKWVDCSDTAPKSTNTSAAAIRPDVGFVSKETDPNILKFYTKQWIEFRESRTMKTRSMTREENKKEQGLQRIWWLQMLGPGEFKVDNDVESALWQLCTYIKQAFREQLDRRFIIGFTLCLDQLNVYLFDRSGVIGTQDSINIHKQPKKFIQFLASYSTLTAERLGWDPTMKLYSPETGEAIASYTYPWSKEYKGNLEAESLYDRQWVITLGRDSRWITIRALTVVGSEIMCGRATVVWEVVKFKDFEKRNEVYVLKQSWQRLPGQKHDESLGETPFERFAYDTAGFADRLEATEYVRSSENVPVTTFNFIRKCLEGTRTAPDPLGKKGKISTGHSSAFHSRELYIYKKRIDTEGSGKIILPDAGRQLASRTQTRIVMKTRGCPVQFFINLIEFLQAIHGAVIDHEVLYFRGVLHRDISGGNIVIVIFYKEGDIIGKLIDLDHAKVNGNAEFIDPLTKDLELPEKFIQDFMNDMRKYFKRFISPELIREAFAAFAKRRRDEQLSHGPFKANEFQDALDTAVYWAFRDTEAYITDLFDVFSFETSEERPLLPADVWFGEVPRKQPSFTNHAAGPGYRTGTLPYMSHAILKISKTPHDAIHDIESFFWVIIGIALGQEGPGGHNRVIEDNSNLKATIHRYFESSKDTLGLSKEELFAPDFKLAGSVLDTIMAHFAPYFVPLRPFVKELWKLLWLAFKHKAYELWCIHKCTLKILEDAIKKLTLHPPQSNSDEQQKHWNLMEMGEINRRKKYQADTLAIIQKHSMKYDG